MVSEMVSDWYQNAIRMVSEWYQEWYQNLFLCKFLGILVRRREKDAGSGRGALATGKSPKAFLAVGKNPL